MSASPLYSYLETTFCDLFNFLPPCPPMYINYVTYTSAVLCAWQHFHFLQNKPVKINQLHINYTSRKLCQNIHLIFLHSCHLLDSFLLFFPFILSFSLFWNVVCSKKTLWCFQMKTNMLCMEINTVLKLILNCTHPTNTSSTKASAMKICHMICLLFFASKVSYSIYPTSYAKL